MNSQSGAKTPLTGLFTGEVWLCVHMCVCTDEWVSNEWVFTNVKCFKE